jgi:outer membrane protein
MCLAGLTLTLPRAALAQERATRIVGIQLERVFNEYYKTRRADAQLKAQAAEFNREREAMKQDLEKVNKEYTALREEAQNPALTEEARATRRTQAEEMILSIREKEGQIRQFEDLRSKQLEDQSRRMRRGLIEEIRESIRAYGREKGYDMIVDLSGNSLNGVEVMLYADNRFDVTSEVLIALNRDAPDMSSGTPAAAEGAATP